MKTGSQKYLERIFRNKSTVDLLRWEVIPNAKEYTEVMAFLYAISDQLKRPLNNPNFTIVVVGDGSTPRLAATMAVNSAWECISIDPQMNAGLWNKECKRLVTHNCKIQDIKYDLTTHTVVCFPHSHVNIDVAMKSITAPTVDIIANPCCNPLFIKGVPHHIEYDEKHMWSSKNLMKIWKDLTIYKK